MTVVMDLLATVAVAVAAARLQASVVTAETAAPPERVLLLVPLLVSQGERASLQGRLTFMKRYL